jgi:hypothetical protein
MTINCNHTHSTTLFNLFLEIPSAAKITRASLLKKRGSAQLGLPLINLIWHQQTDRALSPIAPNSIGTEYLVKKINPEK